MPLILDRARIAVEDDAPLAGERDEAPSPGATDQGQPGLARELDAPGGEARARDQDRDAHLHRLDDHLRGQATGGVEDLSLGTDAVQMQVAGNLVDGVVAAAIL